MTLLTSEDALKGGVELWILPPFRLSAWTRSLDWPMNLQITGAIHRHAAELGSELKQIIADNDLNDIAVKFPATGPLLLASEGLLPCRMVVIVDQTRAKDWYRESFAVWKKLGGPRLRLFLPAESNWGDAQQETPDWAKQGQIEIVETEGTPP